MKICKKCNTQMKDSAKFCPVCGEPVQLPAAPKEDRTHFQKKSAAPFIAICAVLILAMAGGAGFFVWKMKSGQKQETAAKDGSGWDSQSQLAKKESQITVPETTAAPVTAAMTTAAPETAAMPAAAPETAVVPQAVPAEYATMYVVNCSEFITLRNSPSPGSGELAQIPLGAAVSYIGTAADGFYQVAYNGHTGYALASYLSMEKPDVQSVPVAAGAVYDTLYVANCNASITLRTSDSTGAGEICQIPLGSAVSYVSAAGNGFYKIIYNGHTGYALASYLSTVQSYVPANNAYVYDTMYVVNCKESITLRTSDSTSASEICQIPLGATVSFVSAAGNGFYKIIYLGKTGYSLASYLSY